MWDTVCPSEGVDFPGRWVLPTLKVDLVLFCQEQKEPRKEKGMRYLEAETVKESRILNPFPLISVVLYEVRVPCVRTRY